MKFLFITYYFPPKNAIASFRVSSFADYFSKNNHDVTVIAPEWPGEKIADKAGYRVLYSHKADDGIFTDSGTSLKSLIRREILYKIFAYNNFRDRKPGTFFAAAKNVIDTVDFSDYDVVLSSFGPLDSIWIGRYVKEKYPHIRWIIDYRDYYSLFYKDFGIFKPHFRAWERKLVKSCDGFITVSETLRANIAKLIGKKGHVIYNGFLNFDLNPDHAFVEGLQSYKPYLCYTGSLYHGHRDIEPFISYYARHLVQSYSLILALIDPLDIEYAKKVCQKFNVSDRVKFMDRVSHNQSLLLIQNAEHPILFNHFDKRSNGFLTGKIFEYIYFRKKVIYCGATEKNELYDLFITHGWGENFDRFNYGDTTMIVEQDIELFSRSHQAQRLVRILENEAGI
jgi:hypothetical protein